MYAKGLIDYLIMPQQVITPNHHMAVVTVKRLIHINKLAILLYCVTMYIHSRNGQYQKFHVTILS